MNYRIVEENRRIWIEESKDGNKWEVTKTHHVPQFHRTVADARSWVATLQKGRIIHNVEDDGLQWFLDRVGKMIVRDGMTLKILDDDHARHLHTASVEMGYTYTDAPNLPVDERKAEKDVYVSPEDRALIFSRDIRC